MATPQEEATHEITAASTDAQINAKANRIAYTTGTNGWVLGRLFWLEREVARLSAGLPHLRDVEKR